MKFCTNLLFAALKSQNSMKFCSHSKSQCLTFAQMSQTKVIFLRAMSVQYCTMYILEKNKTLLELILYFSNFVHVPFIRTFYLWCNKLCIPNQTSYLSNCRAWTRGTRLQAPRLTWATVPCLCTFKRIRCVKLFFFCTNLGCFFFLPSSQGFCFLQLGHVNIIWEYNKTISPIIGTPE